MKNESVREEGGKWGPWGATEHHGQQEDERGEEMEWESRDERKEAERIWEREREKKGGERREMRKRGQVLAVASSSLRHQNPRRKKKR
jgi:hypothetical protein